MRLRSLELHGYKTFATKTEFVFDGGITAIVGPNGSGKSNVADAVRWVLGEQSYRLLRAKRTEDMIFHGSAQRARVGMAQATLTFDNSTHWIPLDFSEVTISRRAYRSGENEYYVNSSRVRLKDVTELLAKSGLIKRNSIVIGQGHIDAALSLRPEERRSLFEEAANITYYQDKRSATINRLEATEQNLLRVNDVVAEIAPRLKTLHRQAQQAEIYHSLTKELEDLLRILYGYQWEKGRRELHRARERLNSARQDLSAKQTRLTHREQQGLAVRDEQNTVRRRVAEWHQASADLHTQAESVQRELAIIRERIRLVGRQLGELQEELTPLKASHNAQAERLKSAETLLQTLEGECERTAEALRDVESQYGAQQQLRQGLLAEATVAQNEAFDLATRAADRRNRLKQLDERKREYVEDAGTHNQAIAAQRSELENLRGERQRLEAERAGLREQAAALEDALSKAAQDIRESQARAQEQTQGLARLREQQASLSTRIEMLSRMREEMTGFYGGPRAVVAAARGGQLRGIIGAVAEQISVPPELEKAIETALGAHLQDVITRRWSDAEDAIQYLHREAAGRATFLPLETLRPTAPLRPLPAPGLLGVASELVRAAEPLAPVLDLLLGHTLVVHDLKAARVLFSQMQGSFQIVTLQGELLRSGGSVTGGADTRKPQGLISRRREYAELESQAADLAHRRSELESKLGQAQSEEEAARRMLATRRQEAEAVERQDSEVRAALAEVQRQIDKKAQEAEWREALVGQLEDNLEGLAQKKAQTEQELADLSRSEIECRERLAALEAQIAELPDNLAVPLAEARAAASLAEQNVENQKAICRSHQQSLEQLDQQLAARQSRIQALQAERADLDATEKDLGERADALAAKLTEANAQIHPAEARLAELETTYGEQDLTIQKERLDLRQAEQEHNQALLEMERRRDELASVKRQIEADLGLVDVEGTDGLPSQPPLPLRPLVQSLPSVDRLPPNLEQQVHELKGQIRRLGAVNPTAPAEYRETLERHNFLTSQSQDLQEAIKSLRTAIAELDSIMNQELVRVFEAVAEQFSESFARLFGGGTARLVLTDPENPMLSGVEIVARPPGKRTQSLALLSGGERSLTAAALIFSILKVSPAPFCVLDEVDAMLDESNVRRFRDMLTELAQTTQFIVITHNRGTIEAARTIYGITMGADSVSRTLSLQLDQVEAKM